MNKSFKELDLCNTYLFSAALENPDTCRLVLEIILGTKLPNLTVRAEHSILVSSDFRSIRLDIYAKDDMEVHYNVESQNYDKHNLAKRSRYHQAEMDISSLKPQEDFNDLKPSYIIFICDYDPFDLNLYRYTFEERCLERDFSLGDETTKIFLNTKGTNREEVSEELIHFLGYMHESTESYVSSVDDKSIHDLHKKVTELKARRELEAGYMTFEEICRCERNEGKSEGLSEGRSEGISLGLIQGISEAILELLEDLGPVPEELHDRIMSEKDIQILKSWNKKAAKATSMEEFEKSIS